MNEESGFQECSEDFQIHGANKWQAHNQMFFGCINLFTKLYCKADTNGPPCKVKIPWPTLQDDSIIGKLIHHPRDRQDMGCAQSCLTLCDPMDCSLPGSSVHGISQVRILEWVAISYSRGSSRPRDQTPVSCIFCIDRWILYHDMLQKKSSHFLWDARESFQEGILSDLGLRGWCGLVE